MIEPRWEVKIGSHVMTTDAEFGRLHQLILDPRQARVTALLVRRNSTHPAHILVVPVDLVADATEKEVHLNVYQDQADALPEFGSPSSGADLDSSALTVKDGQQVVCEDDQPAGKVNLVLTKPGGQVTGIVMQMGRLPRRDLIVPLGWIQKVVDGTVNLNVGIGQLESLPEYRSDDALEGDVDNALWSNETLRNTDYYDISVTARNGVVSLHGHVFNPLNKNRVEEAVRTIPGILGIEDNLVVDQELATDVAGAITAINLTPSEHVSVSAHHGFITLSGQVCDAARREAAGVAAAIVPQVRGVANYLQAPDVVDQPQRQPFWQPQIGEDVYATDLLLGHVEKVVINPNNRCVTAFVTRGNFPDLDRVSDGEYPDEDSMQERDVVLPVRWILFDGDSSLRLMVNAVEAARESDASSSNLISPPAIWQPPYPYHLEDVLFDRKGA